MTVRRAGKPFIHPTADVEEGARIGAGTKIWHLTHVRAGARIGRGCTIGRNVYIDANVRIGNRVKIQNGVSVYDGVSLADDVFVGPGVAFTNDLYPRAFPNGWKKLPTIVKKGASFGANATVLCGITIGEFAMIGAGSLVCHDVPPYSLVHGLASPVVGAVSRDGHPNRRNRRPRRRAIRRRRSR